MGIIKNQAIRGTIITYIAVIIGFFTTAIFMPKLETEIVGLVNILIAYTLTIRLIGNLGFGAVTTRLFTYFRSEKNNHNGFMFIAFSVTLIGFGISVIIIVFLKHFLSQHRPADDLFIKYFYYLIPLVFFTLFLNTFDDYYKVNYKAVRGIFLREIIQKSASLFAVIIFVYGLISTDEFVLAYIISYSLPGFIILVMVIYEKQFNLTPQLSFINRNLRNSMCSVGLFGILTSAIGVITLNIDKIMLESYLGLSYTGIYSIAFYFGALIAIPSRSLLKISVTILADAWKEKDMTTIKIIHSKSALTQFIIGSLLFLGIIINLDNIFILLTEKYSEGRFVIIFIGLAFLIDMFSGASLQVITSSSKYKYGTYILVFFAISVIITNLIFIPRFGIAGAAFASLIAKAINNILKIIAVKRLFNLQPYNYKYLVITLMSVSLYFLSNLLLPFNNFIVDIVVRSSSIALIYVFVVYKLNLSEDINNQIDSIIKFISLFLKQGRK